jgi:phosphohistidine swiveling domain-containing protein
VPWHPLARFRDPAVPKLDNLRRAAAAGLRVPETWWLPAAEAAEGAFGPPPSLAGRPVIVRSGSPTEDTQATSNAGQLLSVAVRNPETFREDLSRVVAALPRDGRGQPRGAVFVQPLIAAEEAGVVFFDGFYYERSTAAGSNEELTSGRARGEVVRGHLARDDPFSEWLAAVHRPFRQEAPQIDAELARDGRGYLLLQVRPALFPLVRNETLSLANHREILGDLPCPWMVSVLADAGREALSFFASVDPEVGRWDESYAVELAERAWMSFSFFFRLMDHWGLPRSFVTEGMGGQGGGPADRRLLFRRFVRQSPRLVRLQIRNLTTIAGVDQELSRLDERIAAASGLYDLYRATVAGLALALRANFAINGVLSGVVRARRFLRVRGAARVTTREMMEDYSRLSSISDPASREAALDGWLARYGHRGPLESDLARPRFAELREVLLRDLATAAPSPTQPGDVESPGLLSRPWFRIDEVRERFRDDLMRRWQRLRAAILTEGRRLVAAGEVDAPEDVFLLRRADLESRVPSRDSVRARREKLAQAASLDLPLTASREEIQRAVARTEWTRDEAAGRKVFPGIGLGPACFEGIAVKADDLLALLSRPEDLGPDVILVVPALEPSWAVVFPRVGGVVAEIGGELSHASILLREARRPAVVNCAGIWGAVASGDRLRLDGGKGVVELVALTAPGVQSPPGSR